MNSFKTKVLVTVDTEFSIGGFFENPDNKPVPAEKIIYCRHGSKEYGIGLIMDILDEYGFRGVFFLEVESRHYFGEAYLLKIIEYIVSRGHEVQLHIHPSFRSFLSGTRHSDDLRRYSYDMQYSYISEAINFFDENGMPKVAAFRAGNYCSNYDTIKALDTCNIKFSSNYNLSALKCEYVPADKLINDVCRVGNLIEFPVTNYKEVPLRKPWNSFQLSASSFSEIKSALNFYHKNNVRHVTFITHSFEFVKKRDPQYSSFSPLPFLVKRFESICRFLAENQHRFEVVTFNDLHSTDYSNLDENIDPVFFKTTVPSMLMRYLENFMGKTVA